MSKATLLPGIGLAQWFQTDLIFDRWPPLLQFSGVAFLI
jgi:hypothetical protein